MARSIMVMVTKPPYGTEEAFAGMRQALAMLVSGLVERASVLMVGEGTLNAVSVQEPQALGMPSNADAVEDLIALEGEVYAIREDFEALAPGVESIEGIQLITWEEARVMIDATDLVNTF